MTIKHLTDEELQRYLLNDDIANNDMAAHVRVCEDCMSRVEAYRLVISGIERQPVPVFDFDLQNLVLSQLPATVEKKTADNLSPWIFIGPAIFAAGLLIYFSGSYFPRLFAGIATLATVLVALSACVLATVLVIDMHKTYKKKINTLDLY